MPNDDAHQIGLGRRVATLREAAGLTQAELARRLHVTQSAVSRIESGSRALSAAQVVRLTEILGVDPGTLLSPASPGHRPSPRRASQALMSDVADVLAASPIEDDPVRAADVRRAADVLRGVVEEDDTGFAARPASALPDEASGPSWDDGPQPPSPAFRALEPPLFAAVTSDWFEVAAAAAELRPAAPGVLGLDAHLAGGGGDPVRLARFWRHEFGVGERGPLPDLVVLLEAAGVQVVVARLEDDEPHGACAALPGQPSDAGDAALPRVPFVFINGFGRPVALQRFALAHEFAHLALGHGEAYDERIDWSGRSRREVEANAFAEEFVAPLAAVRHWFEMEGSRAGASRSDRIGDVDTIIGLANHFGVSFWVARYRAKTAGLLTSPTRQREIDRELRRLEWQTIPRQLFLGGLRDTLSVLSSEMRPGQDQNALRIAPEGVRVPGPMRAAVLRLLEAGEAGLEEAQAWLHIGADDLRYQLAQFGVE